MDLLAGSVEPSLPKATINRLHSYYRNRRVKSATQQ
jgi:hypothetical protein